MQDHREQSTFIEHTMQYPETEIAEMLTALNRENNRFGKPFWDRVLVISMALFTLFFILGLILKISLIGEIMFYAGILGGIALVMGIQINFFESETPKHRSLLHALTQWEDVDAVGPLIQALHPSKFHVGQKSALQGKTREAVISVLLRLIPRLCLEDTSLWTPEQRHSMHQSLLTGENVLAVSLLRALAQVGSIDDLPVVQKLVSRQGLAKKSAAVRVEAERCLQLLLQRVEPEQQRKTLVRPAMRGQESAGILVRPAPSSPDSTSALLLRQAEGGEHPPTEG